MGKEFAYPGLRERGSRQRHTAEGYTFGLSSSGSMLTTGKGPGSAGELGDGRTQTERREGGGRVGSPSAARRTRAAARPRPPCDSADPGACGRPRSPAAAVTRAGMGGGGPVLPGPSPDNARNPGRTGTHSPSSNRSVNSLTIALPSVGPAAHFRFRGCPPTSAGSASVRARKEEGRGAPGGSRARPGLPRLQSRGTGGQGRSKGVGWEEGGSGRDVPAGREGADLRSGNNKHLRLVQLKMSSVLWWLHRPHAGPLWGGWYSFRKSKRGIGGMSDLPEIVRLRRQKWNTRRSPGFFFYF